MPYLGDYNEDNTKLGFDFTTRDNSNVPTILAGSPVIEVVKISDNTVKTSAESFITLTAGVKNRVQIDLSGHAFFATGEDYSVHISTGTVDGGTVVDEVVATFSIMNRSPNNALGVAGAGLTAIPWNAAWDVEVQSEVNDALVDLRLDHLVAVPDSDYPVDNSIMAKLVSKTSPADWSTFNNTTDSLEALRDNQGGGSGASTRLITTTITSLSSQIQFNLTAGSGDNAAYEGSMAIITDGSDANQKAVVFINQYTGSSKLVVLTTGDPSFTIANGDTIEIFALPYNRALPSTGVTFSPAKIARDTLTDTAVIGALGVGLSNIPWNASWDAEVQSEVDDALVVNHLDHLFKTNYDPASKPGSATALLNELVENDGGVSRFTTNALEQGPTGSGASAATIADAVWDELDADHNVLGSYGSLDKIIDRAIRKILNLNQRLIVP